jgi:hypothetical protein
MIFKKNTNPPLEKTQQIDNHNNINSKYATPQNDIHVLSNTKVEYSNLPVVK